VHPCASDRALELWLRHLFRREREQGAGDLDLQLRVQDHPGGIRLPDRRVHRHPQGTAAGVPGRAHGLCGHVLQLPKGGGGAPGILVQRVRGRALLTSRLMSPA